MKGMEKKKAKIAIVEDDIAIAQMYRNKFETEGYTVETAGDGVTGLELINEFRPDIILCDLMMPVMNGMEMIDRLRKSSHKDIKIIILTNLGDEETVNKVHALNAADFIVKADMTPTQVLERVKDVLES
jgi:DNA-binding response OmpR family regulator